MLGPALYFHILSLIVLAGGVIGGTIVHVALRDSATASPANVGTYGRLAMRFGITAQVGAACMLLSGLFLLASRGWVDVRQPWLHAKLSLFVLLMVNGIFVARPTGMKLGTTYARNSGDPMLPSLLRRLSIFHATQVIGLAMIIGLGVFGPRVV